MAHGGDSNTARDRALANRTQYEYARDRGHIDFIDKAHACERFFVGYKNLQWDQEVVDRLRARKKPVLTINKIFPTIMTVMGEQLLAVSDVSFRATATGDHAVARALDKVWVHIANTNHFDWVKSEAADSGFITSRGYIDVRMDFTDSMRGEVRLSHKNSKNVVLDPDSSGYDPDDWRQVFLTKWLSYDEINRVYGADLGDLLRSKNGYTTSDITYDMYDIPRNSFGMRFDSEGSPTVYSSKGEKVDRLCRIIERQYKELRRMPHFVDLTTGDLRVVPPTWEPDRIARVLDQTRGVMTIIERNVDVIRWDVSADDVMLFSSVSPYKHFTVVPYFPILVSGQSVGLVENLLSPQEGFNKTRSQEMHVINSTANGGWKVKEGALRNMTVEQLEERGADTGLVLEMDDINGAEKISPNQIPTGLDRSSFKFEADIREISNISDSARGMARADVSGRAIDSQIQRVSVNMAKPIANLVRCETYVARNVLDLVQAFYTEERIVPVIGKSPLAEPETMVVNQITPEGEVVNDLTLGEYETVVVSVPAREQEEDSIFTQAVAMRELGISIPDSVIIESSRLPNKKEILESIQQNQSNEDVEFERMKQQAELESIQAETMLKKASAVEKLAKSRQAANGQQEAAINELKTLSDASAQRESSRRAANLKLVQARLKGVEDDQQEAI